jgi:hypothetical protein
MLLVRRWVAPVMQGIAENGRDTDVVLTAVLEVASDVFGEAWIFLGQEGAHIVEPDRDRGQMLG